MEKQGMYKKIVRRFTKTACSFKSDTKKDTSGNQIEVTLLDGRKVVRQKRSSGPMNARGEDTTDSFVKRYDALEKDVKVPKNGPIPTLKGNYEEWNSFIEDAVKFDAQPSRALIAANYQLAAWEAHLGIGKVSSFPIHLSIAMTDICNARCNFCAYTPERVTGDVLSLEKIEKSDWLKFVRLFRPNAQLGEPFAHPNVIDIFNAIRQRAPFLDLASISNGSLFLRPGVLDLIVGNFSLLYISVNATSKETYERTMPPLKWENFIDNMRGLRDAKIRNNATQPRLDAGYVLYKNNLDDLVALPELLHRFGFSRVNIKAMHPPPRCSSSSKLLTPEDSIFTVPEKADEIFRRTEEEAKRFNIELVRPLPGYEVLTEKYARPDHLKIEAMPYS